LIDIMSNEYKSESVVIKSDPNVTYYNEKAKCENTNLDIIGCIDKPLFMPTATREYKTPLDIEITCEPSIKHSQDPRNINKIRLDYQGLSKYNAIDCEYSRQEWKDAFEAIGDYIVANAISKSYVNRIITKTEAINTPSTFEYPNAKPIDRTGSVGFPWCKLYPRSTDKGDYLEQHHDGLWRFKKDEKSQAMSSAVDLMIEDAKRGTQHHVPFIAYLKDEPLKLKKIYEPATRVFFCAPAPYLYSFRKYFGTAMWMLNSMYMDIPPKVGINGTSLEWHEFAMKHMNVSKFGYASDMKNWDGTVPLVAVQESLGVWNKIYQSTDPNWKPEDDLVRSILHKAVEGTEVIMGKNVYKLNGCMTSGFPATALTNSLINWALHYIVWKRLALKHDPSKAVFSIFMDLTCLSVYGDDNIITIDLSVQKWFNFNTFVAEAFTLGFIVTDAKKTGEAQPDVTPFLELDFLKQGFRLHNGIVYPVIDESSINKQLLWHRCPGSYEYNGEWRYITTHETYTQCLQNLLTKIALGGEDMYNKWKSIIQNAAKGKIMIFIPPYAEALYESGYLGTNYINVPNVNVVNQN